MPQPLEVLEVTGTSPLRVVRVSSKHYRLEGEEILFELIPSTMRMKPVESNAARNPLQLVTKNEEIIIQGDNACSLSYSEWLIVHRLNETKSRTMSIDDACNEELGERLWEINDVPGTEYLRSLASKITTKLSKGGIIARIRFSRNENFHGFSLTIPDKEQENET